MLLQRRIRIEVEGRADLLRDPGDRHVFAVKFIVSVLEVVHKKRECLKCAKMPKVPKMKNPKDKKQKTECTKYETGTARHSRPKQTKKGADPSSSSPFRVFVIGICFGFSCLLPLFHYSDFENYRQLLDQYSCSVRGRAQAALLPCELHFKIINVAPQSPRDPAQEPTVPNHLGPVRVKPLELNGAAVAGRVGLRVDRIMNPASL